MAVLLYSNGIIEEYKAKDFVFTEQEIVDLFSEFEEIKTERLITVLNTWCVYGYSPICDPIDFNKIASELINTDIFSHVLFIHDSEINPDWKVTESILYKGYEEFSTEIRKAIDDVASDIISQLESIPAYQETVNNLPQLFTIGSTPDKRVLFGFNPTDQSSDFYSNEEFYIFSQKVYNYIKQNKQQKEPFTIYADKKAVIIIEPNHVVYFLNAMLEKFKSKEEYEICTDISKMIKSWSTKTKKSGRKKSSNEK